MSTQTTRRTFGTRLLWILKTVFVTFLLLIVILALAGGGYWGVLELQRSFDSVNTQIGANTQAVELLRSDVNGLMGNSPEQQQQLTALQSDLDALNGRLTDLDTRLAEQDTAVADLTAANEELIARTATLEDGLVAMQGDLITNTTQLDTLGGDVDAVRADVTTLDNHVTNLEQVVVTAATQASVAIDSSQVVTLTVDNMQETLILFRAWEIVTRARLRLLENNAGLAATDAQLAVQILTTLAINDDNPLTAVQTRLEQALANLPGNPSGAAQDLERAWDELDRVLAARMGLPEPVVVVEPTPTPTP
ncbi:MAG: hypothetical protein H6662_13100 [Ardenticatenaceae bacterium]|nr:hypothetical protein [Anaerolineales bacterium]MCB8922516.1 hypothetical protein [Ardenticatenaceae bacterium]MCB8989985.1 hypothetical protein [Ardenticatenaceae bacterium]